MTSKGSNRNKTYAIFWSKRAKQDIEEISDYIMADNLFAARNWFDRVISDVERASKIPMAGRMVPEYERSEIREIIRGNYRLVYQVQECSIEVLTDFEGHRLIPQDAIPFKPGQEG